MNTTDGGDIASVVAAVYQLVYLSIHGERCFAFPCDEAGKVELNALTEHARDNYLLARALVGRNFYKPQVVCMQSGVDAGPDLSRCWPASTCTTRDVHGARWPRQPRPYRRAT